MEKAQDKALGFVVGAVIVFVLMLLLHHPQPSPSDADHVIDSLKVRVALSEATQQQAESAAVEISRRYDSLASLDNTKVIYLRARDRWTKNISGDSVRAFLHQRPTDLWNAQYPGRHDTDSSAVE